MSCYEIFLAHWIQRWMRWAQVSKCRGRIWTQFMWTPSLFLFPSLTHRDFYYLPLPFLNKAIAYTKKDHRWVFTFLQPGLQTTKCPNPKWWQISGVIWSTLAGTGEQNLSWVPCVLSPGWWPPSWVYLYLLPFGLIDGTYSCTLLTSSERHRPQRWSKNTAIQKELGRRRSRG